MYKKLNEMLAEGYLETKLQDEVAASLGVNEASGEDMGIDKNKAKEGVYILHTNGKLYDRDSWNSGAKDAVGVALIDKKGRFVIAPDGICGIPWGISDCEFDDSYCYATYDSRVVLKTFNDKESSEGIAKYFKNLKPNQCAAKYCHQYQFKNGKHGYLASGGQMEAIYKNLKVINSILEKIGGMKFNTKSNSEGSLQWISSQTDESSAWVFNLNNGYAEIIRKRASSPELGVRPLTEL